MTTIGVTLDVVQEIMEKNLNLGGHICRLLKQVVFGVVARPILACIITQSVHY